MERYDLNFRLLAASIGIYIYLLVSFRNMTLIFTVIFIFLYFLIVNIRRNNGFINYDRFETARRQNALNNARLYLSPYKSIWKNLKLSNKYCSLSLGSDGVSITGKEKKTSSGEPCRTFNAVISRVHANNDLWDMFCLHFDHLTSYDRLVELCGCFKVTIVETVVGVNSNTKPLIKTNDIKEAVEKTDINNASEIELTALPGISIVMSKKIIKKREEIGGFKNINEFFVYMKLKPHMETQLRNLVVVKKMRGSVSIQKYTERKVDL